MTHNVTNRFSAPADAEPYRSIGPFDVASLPAGLLREHRLKQGTWARLTVLTGQIGFVWDDGESNGERDGGVNVLSTGNTIDVPPTVPHHLEIRDEQFRIAIEFLAEPLLAT